MCQTLFAGKKIKKKQGKIFLVPKSSGPFLPELPLKLTKGSCKLRVYAGGDD